MVRGLVALEQAQATGEVQREEEPGSALEYLQDIYKGRRQPDHVRMRAAAIALPFESPKLAVTGYVSDDSAFAIALEKAITRSREGKVVLELQANPATANAEGAGEVAAGKAGRRYG
jgi:hypothetical protein